MLTDTIIIGGGQAGLALSRCLAERGIEHLVLERGRVAERWRSGHWDSLRLLTPNWQSRLPGFRYDGADTDGYMRSGEVADYLARYADSFDAPVLTETNVQAVERCGTRFLVTTDRGRWEARAVVLATGYCDLPSVPGLARELPAGIQQLTAASYRNPAQLARGGVLVVGAAASGVQIADELQRSGRQVTLAVGKHTRLPRTYRDVDIMRWLDAMGVLDQRAEEVPDLDAAVHQPSLQLVGREDRHSLDLGALRARGVRLVGRALRASGTRLHFADDLAATVAAADQKLTRLLDRIDAFAVARAEGCGRAERPEPLRMPPRPTTALNLSTAGIQTVLWATGYRRSYPFLKLPALDAQGELRQRGGVCELPGLYAIGLRFQCRRKSNFLDGVGADARELVAHIAAWLGARASAAA
jgi:putative flavoprotein involved in K+ transport